MLGPVIRTKFLHKLGGEVCNGGVYYQFVLHIASFLSGGLVQESTDESRLNQNEGIDRDETLVHHYK